MSFTFDPSLSAAQNIEKFYKHMESVDQELADLLKVNLKAMLPLPENAAQKTQARQRFNAAVLKVLDTPKVVKKP